MVYKITLKDWNRMQDLIDANKNGNKVAEKIKDVGKAVARYVAGVKLLGVTDIKNRRTWEMFECFLTKAYQLGVKFSDVEETFNNTSIPENFREEKKLKKTYSGYLGSLERLFDKMIEKYGVEITKKEMKNGTQGRWWSDTTSYSYSVNGRCWPLNYWVKVSKGDEYIEIPIIVVTNEGGGLYGYDYNGIRMPFKVMSARFKEDIEKFLKN